MKNTNVPLIMKLLLLSVYNDRPYDNSNATTISINPVIPAFMRRTLPPKNARKYETSTTKITITIGLLINLNKNGFEIEGPWS